MDDERLAAAAQREVVELHAFFEAWLGGGEVADGFDRCTRALADDFTMVTPDGEVLGRAPLVARIEAGRDGQPGLRLWVDGCTVRLVAGAVCVVLYEEWQRVGGRTMARRSTAVFERRAAAPCGVVWRHLQETWMPA